MDPASFLAGSAFGVVATLAVLASIASWAVRMGELVEATEETTGGLRAGDMAQCEDGQHRQHIRMGGDSAS